MVLASSLAKWQMASGMPIKNKTSCTHFTYLKEMPIPILIKTTTQYL